MLESEGIEMSLNKIRRLKESAFVFFKSAALSGYDAAKCATFADTHLNLSAESRNALLRVLAEHAKVSVLRSELKARKLRNFEWAVKSDAMNEDCKNIGNVVVSFFFEIVGVDGNVEQRAIDLSVDEARTFHEEIKRIEQSL